LRHGAKKAAQEAPPALKKGADVPINTLDVVTGPPEVGEVNTNGRA
jgi:hypothetical protein